MKLKLIFQLILILIILSILVIFYISFFKKNEKEITINSEKPEKIIENIDSKIANQLTNVEYNSSDSKGNKFYLNAKKASINAESKESNFVHLEGVTSIIYIKNKGMINIYSSNALYDKNTHDTLFYNNVQIEYLNNLISSENFDVIFTKNFSKIYNNVIYKNNKVTLNTDQMLIDMKTGDIKLEMINTGDKVKLITKYEYIN